VTDAADIAALGEAARETMAVGAAWSLDALNGARLAHTLIIRGDATVRAPRVIDASPRICGAWTIPTADREMAPSASVAVPCTRTTPVEEADIPARVGTATPWTETAADPDPTRAPIVALRSPVAAVEAVPPDALRERSARILDVVP
jgi:hypothetical protein